MKKLLLPCLALGMFLPACTPDEELIEPTNNPALDAVFVGEWHHEYWGSGDGSGDDEFYPTNNSYFFLPDGSGYSAGHNAQNSVRPFQYQTYVNSLFLEFSDNNEEAYDYSINSDSSIIYLNRIEESEYYWARLLRQ